MTNPFREMLSDASTIPLISTALLTAAYSSYRANEPNLKHLLHPSTTSNRRPSLTTFPDQLIDENTHMLQGSAALAFPLIATLSLIILYFFLRSFGIFFTLLSTISGFFALLFVLWPFAYALAKRLPSTLSRLAGTPHTAATILSLPPAVIVLFAWLFTGHWIPNNIIGISLCVLFASICKVPNLKVTTMLFIGLFFYDIFFVFFSKHIFGGNVMVEVATTAPTNPASAVASWLHLPITPVKNLALPAKLIVPTSDGHQAILGLGDIILPEVLLVYLLHFDIACMSGAYPLLSSSSSSTPKLRAGYFIAALLAYGVALTVSFFCNYAFRAAQPALLYIVPAVLVVACGLAVQRGQMAVLWAGLEGEAGGEGVREIQEEGDNRPINDDRSHEAFSLLDSRSGSQVGAQNV